eukprot:Hpha_TRINITY_DN16524_c2_g4::TRINITY_DN16524_c2_g4_i2::g.133812::m.133812
MRGGGAMPGSDVPRTIRLPQRRTSAQTDPYPTPQEVHLPPQAFTGAGRRRDGSVRDTSSSLRVSSSSTLRVGFSVVDPPAPPAPTPSPPRGGVDPRALLSCAAEGLPGSGQEGNSSEETVRQLVACADMLLRDKERCEADALAAKAELSSMRSIVQKLNGEIESLSERCLGVQREAVDRSALCDALETEVALLWIGRGGGGRRQRSVERT